MQVGQLATRAMLHACRALFSVPRADRQLDNLSFRAHALLDQKPKTVAGRQVFLRDLVRAAQDGSIKPLTKTEIQQIFCHHAVAYRHLSDAEKEQYRLKAVKEQEHAYHNVAEELRALVSTLRLEHSRRTALHTVEGVSHSLNNCRLQNHALQDLLGRVQQMLQTPALVSSRKQAAMEPPCLPHQQEVLALEACPDASVSFAKPQVPTWIKQLCKCRQKFARCIFRWGPEEKTQYSILLFAMQNPYSVHFQALREVRSLTLCDPNASMSEVRAHMQKSWDYVFQFEGEILGLSEVAEVDVESVLVFADPIFSEGNVVATHSSPLLFEEILEHLDVPSKDKDITQPKAKKIKLDHTRITPEMLECFPWLSEELQSTPKVLQSRTTSQGSSQHRSDRTIPADADKDALELAVEELRKKREEWVAENENHCEMFVTELRGGRWTKAVMDKAYDAVAAKAAQIHVKHWCRLNSLPVMASYSIAKFGEHLASLLAISWCAKMQWLWELSAEGADDQKLKLDSATFDSYVPSPELTEALQSLPASHPAVTRTDEILNIGKALVTHPV